MEKRLLIFMLLFVNTFLMSAGFVTNGSYVSGTVDIAFQTVKSNTSLIFATSDFVELLINKCPDINTVNSFGFTPLRFFKEQGK